MSDLAKKNNGGETNGANGTGTNGGVGGANETDANGKTDAPLSAAELYRRGRALAFGLDGVRIDGPRGLALLEAAAEAGSLDAQGELAEAFFDGLQGTRPDAARAVDVAQKPAEAGNPFALDTLGAAYRDGSGGLRKDAKKARAFFARAFEGFKRMSEEPNPDARALCYLGCYLGDGRGSANGKPNESRKVAAETARLWRRSAEHGCATAATNLAGAYLNGVGVEKDEAEGVRWLRAA
ncbi:MAG: sel1 repeat family protein, partial [Thermoguttaceae bacterium]|nr:sel1 repeat family protein [Thermoguttaceae bacterium]